MGPNVSWMILDHVSCKPIMVSRVQPSDHVGIVGDVGSGRGGTGHGGDLTWVVIQSVSGTAEGDGGRQESAVKRLC